ncbi:unnamed protein product [Linum tenue]|uniref:Uncharacterized protein n=2 Tax=Linum tenue TaxID=586396 RepID=A0AAV0M9F1_9ROSI|nr:unnamed protein product [Linum tenue]
MPTVNVGNDAESGSSLSSWKQDVGTEVLWVEHDGICEESNDVQLLSKSHEDVVSTCKPEDSVDGKTNRSMLPHRLEFWLDWRWKEDLSVWMRTAALLPTFRKLYGRIEEDLEANDQIEVAIQNNYNSYGYGRKKMLILSTNTWIEGIIGAVYLAVGGICFFLAITFILIYLLKVQAIR